MNNKSDINSKIFS